MSQEYFSVISRELTTKSSMFIFQTSVSITNPLNSHIFHMITSYFMVSKMTRQFDRCFNTLRPIQNGRHFADDTFKRIFLNENVRISIKISMKFVPKGQVNNIPALVQIMAWRRPGDKPLSEPMLFCLLTQICVIRHQLVKRLPRDHMHGSMHIISGMDAEYHRNWWNTPICWLWQTWTSVM